MRLINMLVQIAAARGTTLILMVVAAVEMGIITFYEAADTDDTKPYYLYFSWWFSGLLILVWVNLLLQMRRAAWWRWKKIPLTSIHVGFLLILTGAYLTHAFGLDGRLRISEGDSRDLFHVTEPVLTAEFDIEGSPHRRSFIVEPDGDLKSESILQLLNPFADKSSMELDNGETISIIESIESSRIVEEAVSDPSGRGPSALTLEIELQETRRITLQNWQKVSLHGGALSQIVHAAAPEEKEIPDIVKSVFDEYIEIRPEGKPEVRVPVKLPGDLDREFSVEGYTFRIVEYHPDFKVGAEPDLSAPPVNPAVRLEVDGPDESKALITFAYFQHPGNRLQDGTTFRYGRPEQGLTALFVSGQDERVELYTSGDAEPKVIARDEPVRFDEEGAPVTVKWISFLPSVEMVQRLESDPGGDGPPAYRVRVGESGEPALLRTDHGVAVAKDGRTRVFLSHAYDLGFTLTLDNAVAKHWQGSRIARAYYSLAKLKTPDDPEPRPVRIETNAPLFRNGFRLYQTSMDPQPPYRWSEFEVARDPGYPLVAAGFLILSAGFLWFFGKKFVWQPLRRRRSRSDPEEVAEGRAVA